MLVASNFLWGASIRTKKQPMLLDAVRNNDWDALDGTMLVVLLEESNNLMDIVDASMLKETWKHCMAIGCIQKEKEKAELVMKVVRQLLDEEYPISRRGLFRYYQYDTLLLTSAGKDTDPEDS